MPEPIVQPTVGSGFLKDPSEREALSDPIALAGVIYAPYLDLSDAHPDAPYHVHGLVWATQDLLEDTFRGFIQASVNASFREELTTHTLAVYEGGSLEELPEELVSESWLAVRDFGRSIQSLGDDAALKLGWVVSRLGFHAQALELLSNVESVRADIEYLRSWCRFRLSLDGVGVFQAKEFARIFEMCTPGVTKVDCAYQMVKSYGRSSSQIEQAKYWQEQHRSALDELPGLVDEDCAQRLSSRYHRVGGFIPQLEGDPVGVAAEMGAAEGIARGLPRLSADQQMLADEMLYPCLESRIKEAVWVNDLELAMVRAAEYIELRPLDGKGWFHAGDTYLAMKDYENAVTCFKMAEALAPPGQAIAQFMQAHCYEVMGLKSEALASYIASTTSDPLAVSSYEGIVRVADSGTVGKTLRSLALSNAQELRRRLNPSQ
ncbi:MAG TPA: hypothetical protein VFU43_03985 [Streptosporangiaceae bacterium]|nr:hypothetical protein [Streptosporangiaceae bacterium]